MLRFLVKTDDQSRTVSNIIPSLTMGFIVYLLVFVYVLMVNGCLYFGNARNELFEIIGAWAAFIPGAFAGEFAYPRKVQFFSHPGGISVSVIFYRKKCVFSSERTPLLLKRAAPVTDIYNISIYSRPT